MASIQQPTNFNPGMKILFPSFQLTDVCSPPGQVFSLPPPIKLPEGAQSSMGSTAVASNHVSPSCFARMLVALMLAVGELLQPFPHNTGLSVLQRMSSCAFWSRGRRCRCSDIVTLEAWDRLSVGV